MERELYQWQEECLKKWFANHGRGMVQAVTGSGKTLLALAAADRLERRLNQSLRVKIVVPTGALMRQWDCALREFLGEGELHGSRSENQCKNQPENQYGSMQESQPENQYGSMQESQPENRYGSMQENQCGIPRKNQPGNLQRKIGLRGGGYKNTPDCKYMIYVINSARYELARHILTDLRNGEAVLLIADECHHYESGQNQLIFEFLPHIKPYEPLFFSLGLSATLPSGQAGHYLASVLGKRIYSYGMAKALAMRTVCQYDIFHISLSFQGVERAEYEELTNRMSVLYSRLLQLYPSLNNMEQKERYELLRMLSGDKNRKAAEAASKYMSYSYRRKSLVCLASDRIACASDLTDRLDPGEKVLIFGERISQADELYGFLQARYPGRVGRYHSKMGQQANKNVLERFRVGEVRILIACKAIDEGMDVPDVSVGIILSGTSTQRQRTQRLGRIIRKKENKGRASLYYLHITETSEDSCFLPEEKGNRVIELEYLSDMGEFYNPVYNKKAVLFLEKLRNEDADNGKIKEAERCLRLGSVRSDWLLPYEDIREQIQCAKYNRDRNYWICMKKLQEMTSV